MEYEEIEKEHDMFDEIIKKDEYHEEKGWSIDDTEECDKEVKAIMNKKNVDPEEETIDVIIQDEHDDLPDSNDVLAGATSGKWKVDY